MATEKILKLNTTTGAIDGQTTDADLANIVSANIKASLEGALVALTGANVAVDSTTLATQIALSGGGYLTQVNRAVRYVKTDTGAPTGTSAVGEVVLNTADADIYLDSGGGGWTGALAVSALDRFIFKSDGSDGSGDNGTFTKDNKIYEFNGTTFDETVPTNGIKTIVLIDDDTAKSPRISYCFNGTSSTWVLTESKFDHNSLGGIDGGGTNHLSDDINTGLTTATTIDTNNKVFTADDRDRTQDSKDFAFYGGMPISLTNQEVISVGGRAGVPAKAAGSIISITRQGGVISQGSLSFQPSIAGVGVSGTPLNFSTQTNQQNPYFLVNQEEY